MKKEKEIKEKKTKTPEERENEVKEIIMMLNSLQLTIKFDGMVDFYKKLIEFKKTGEYWEGKIKLPQFGREIQGFLTNKAGCPSQVKLVSV